MNGRVLVTGGAGFMGSAVVRALCRDRFDVVVYDALTYAGSAANLVGCPAALVHADICDYERLLDEVRRVDLVVHMAAESHVERSLADAAVFVRTNVDGTRSVLQACAATVRPLVHLSTDEVFGSAADGYAFRDDDPFRPGNPYAATKAAAECLVSAWRHAYGLPVRIVRCTNNFGPRQHVEKAIPGWIQCALRGAPLPVHGQGAAVRDWLHVDDFVRALLRIVAFEGERSVFHLAGRNPRSNLDVAALVNDLAAGVGLEHVMDRPGQDARYALDDEGTRADLGWAPEVPFEEGVRALVASERRRLVA